MSSGQNQHNKCFSYILQLNNTNHCGQPIEYHYNFEYTAPFGTCHNNQMDSLLSLNQSCTTGDSIINGFAVFEYDKHPVSVSLMRGWDSHPEGNGTKVFAVHQGSFDCSTMPVGYVMRKNVDEAGKQGSAIVVGNGNSVGVMTHSPFDSVPGGPGEQCPNFSAGSRIGVGGQVGQVAIFGMVVALLLQRSL